MHSTKYVCLSHVKGRYECITFSLAICSHAYVTVRGFFIYDACLHTKKATWLSFPMSIRFVRALCKTTCVQYAPFLSERVCACIRSQSVIYHLRIVRSRNLIWVLHQHAIVGEYATDAHTWILVYDQHPVKLHVSRTLVFTWTSIMLCLYK